MTDIRALILDKISQSLKQQGSELTVEDIDSEVSLLELGVLDSLAFVDLVFELEGKASKPVPIADIDPFEHTSINGLTLFFS